MPSTPVDAHLDLTDPDLLADHLPLDEFAWLRQNHRTRFLLTAPPLRLPGAVGSPANAVAVL